MRHNEKYTWLQNKWQGMVTQYACIILAAGCGAKQALSEAWSEFWRYRRAVLASLESDKESEEDKAFCWKYLDMFNPHKHSVSEDILKQYTSEITEAG